MLTESAVSSATLAFVTTIHLALASLRNHRSRSNHGISSRALVSAALAAAPWFFPSAVGVLAGLVVHAAWFGACEQYVRGVSPAHAPTAATPAAVASASPAPVHPATTRRPPQRQTAFVQAPVLCAFDETADIKTIRVARPNGFEFEAGQFITVKIRANGAEQARCYSISSAPDVRGYLEISVKRQGMVSNALHATARPGAMLSLRSPNGKFRYPSDDDRPIVLLAGGVGITPLISMLRHAVGTEPTRPVTLVYGAQTMADFAFRDELLALAGRHPQLRVFFAASRQPELPPDVYPGRIDSGLLRTAVPDLKHSIAFICGPSPMVEGMRSMLTAAGLGAPQIRFEVFQAAIASSARAPAADATAAAAGPSRASQMQCSKARKTVSVAAGQTLLEAAEDAGIGVPVLCRAGVCGTCRTRVTEGAVECSSTTLDDDDRRSGFVLPCVATALSDCTVEL